MSNQYYRFYMYEEFDAIFELLDDAEVGQLVRAVMRYKKIKEVEELPKHLAVSFNVIKKKLDADEISRAKQCEISRLNGSNGGRPRKTEITQSVNLQPKKGYTDEEDDAKHIHTTTQAESKQNVLLETLKSNKQFWESIMQSRNSSDVEKLTDTANFVCRCLSMREIKRITPDKYLKLLNLWDKTHTADKSKRYFRACYNNLFPPPLEPEQIDYDEIENYERKGLI